MMKESLELKELSLHSIFVIDKKSNMYEYCNHSYVLLVVKRPCLNFFYTYNH